MHLPRLAALLSMGLLLPIALPRPVNAAELCSVAVEDTVAGLGTEGQLEGCLLSARITLRVRAHDGVAFTQVVETDRQGAAVFAIPSKHLTLAGRYEVTGDESDAARFTVIADRPDADISRLRASPTIVAAGEESTVTILTIDTYGNPVGNRPIALVTSDPQAQIDAHARLTDASGRLSWTVASHQGGNLTLTAYDLLGNKAIGSAQLTVGEGIRGPYAALIDESGRTNRSFQEEEGLARRIRGGEGGEDFGPVDSFEIRVKEREIAVSQQFTITLIARDSQKRVVEDYQGTIAFTSDDPDAEFPGGGRAIFPDKALGVRTFALATRFRSAGRKTIEVYDAENPQIRGSTTVNVAGNGGSDSGQIDILYPPNNATVGKPEVEVHGRIASFVNVEILGGTERVKGETDEQGVFRINVPLDPSKQNHTLFVSSAGYGTAQVSVNLDTTPPTIESIAFDPEEGTAGMPAVATVRSEPHLSSLTLRIGSETIELREGNSGSYTATFTAPAAKEYDVEFSATDAAGNTSTMLYKWRVVPKGLPQVRGVRAEGKARAIALSWEPLRKDLEATQYRIYIGETPDNYLYVQEVSSEVSAVTIVDVEAGKPYIFSVTALNAAGEESEPSDPVSATAIGIVVRVTPGDGKLLLEWNKPADLPLAQYILEYGVEPGQYTERRSLNGELQLTVLDDLINGVTYQGRLEPVLVTGKVAEELAATFSGTPNGSGFRPGPGEPIPPGSIVSPPPTAPRTTGTGLPSPFLWSIAAGALLVGIIVRQHRRQRRLTSEFLKVMEGRYGGVQ